MGDALAQVHQHEAVQVERLPDEVDKKEQLKTTKVCQRRTINNYNVEKGLIRQYSGVVGK